MRSRTIEWDDPVATLQLVTGLSGLDAMRAIMRGDVPPPPIALLMGFEIVEVEAGRVVFALEPAEYHYNPIGSVHGGVAATLLDSAMGCAVQTLLPAGAGYSTLEIKVNYIRAMTRETGRALCDATVLHAGRTSAVAEGRLTSEATGKLLAAGSTTCSVVRPPR
jgi:uncharacterized protein (TIGR00369 family)